MSKLLGRDRAGAGHLAGRGRVRAAGRDGGAGGRPGRGAVLLNSGPGGAAGW